MTPDIEDRATKENLQGAVTRRPRYEDYDVVVVGARVAGAATAMLLARAGLDVLMVDRSPRGADTTSTHTILRSGMLQLQRWGLRDRLEALGAPPIRRVTLGFGSELVPIDLSAAFGVEALFAPRRDMLDPLLVSASTDAGAEYLDRCRATELLFNDDGGVAGLTVQLDDSTHAIGARMVIGADGTYSRVARWVGAETYFEEPAMNAVYYAYYTGIETDGVYFQFTPGVTAGLIPTNDGEACVYAGWPVGESGPFHSDAEEAFAGRVRSAHPRLASALMGATRVSKFRGTPGLPSFLKQPGGPGWALVGDAGYTKDPVSAHGMSDALRDAELCAWAVETALARPNEAALAMAMYRETRDRLSRSLLDATNRLASYDWSSAEASTLMRQVSTSVHEECRALSTLDTQIGGLVSTG